MDYLRRMKRPCECGLTRPWITAKAWLMACGDNPEANTASNEHAYVLVAGQPDPDGMNWRALREELIVW
eukprot:5867111-Pleurochrysis_carterae.AAC.2